MLIKDRIRKLMFKKFCLLLTSVPVIYRGKFILIKDEGWRCEAIVGSEISPERLRLLLSKTYKMSIQN